MGLGIGKPIRKVDSETGEVTETIAEYIEDLPDSDDIFELGDWTDSPSGVMDSDNPNKALNTLMQKTGISFKEVYQAEKRYDQIRNLSFELKANHQNEDSFALFWSEKEFLNLIKNHDVSFTDFKELTPISIYENAGIKRSLKKKLSNAGYTKKQLQDIEKKADEITDLAGDFDFASLAVSGGSGVAAALAVQNDEENSLSQAGLGGVTAALFGRKFKKVFTSAIKKGATKAKVQNAKDESIRAKGGTPTPEPEPIGRAAVVAKRKNKSQPGRVRNPIDITNYYSEELLELLNRNKTDARIHTIVVSELSRRAARDTPAGRRLQAKLSEQINKGEAPVEAATTTPAQADRGVRDMKKDELLSNAIKGNPQAKDEILRRAENNPKTKKFFESHNIISGILTTGAGAGAVMSMLMDDDETVSKASFGGGEILVALALATLGYKGTKKYVKSAEFKRAKAQVKANPSAAEPSILKEARVKQEAGRIYKSPSEARAMIKDVMDIAGDVLTPLSRQAKNIGAFVAKAFRDVDYKGLKRKAEFKRAAHPFLLSVNKLLKNDKVALEKFKTDLNTQNYDGIREMLDEKKVMHKFGKEFEDTINTLEAIRAYAREEGGIDVGFLERYFPRQVKDYPSLRKFMDEDPEFREATNSIDQAFAKYADENKVTVENLTNQERAEITSRVLAGRMQSNVPGNAKSRSINDAKLYEKVKGAYVEPLDALNNYIDSMVDAVEKRKFLGMVRSKDAPNVGAEGSLDTNPLADLGMRADISDTLADKVAKDMLKGQEFSEQDVQKLRGLIQSRFGGVPVSPAIQGLKNANYIQVMTNFGSAITQLGDLAFSAHFNGMGNTFKSLFKRKDVYDFADSVGLSGKDYDSTNSSAFLGKTLDTLFTATGLKQLDKLGKNTFMNASWAKYHKLAKKDTQGLVDELTPYFGKQRAEEISITVRDNAPNSKFVPQEVEELVFHKLLDVAPATASEMPALYTRMGKGRIFYMLKSFTLKQLDAYREAGADEIFRGIGKYNAATTSGERLAAAKQSGKGLAKLTQLAAIFAAANASTDVIKDTLAGRPTKKDELLENNIWKLFGLNRYTYYNAKRQGVGKAAVELMLPPTAVFDRAWTDIKSTLTDEKYKGAMLQGTPLDLIYWRYLGGLDKVKNMK